MSCEGLGATHSIGCECWEEGHAKEKAELKAENARLREALEQLAINANRVNDVYPPEYRGTYVEDLMYSVDVARAALSGEVKHE